MAEKTESKEFDLFLSWCKCSHVLGPLDMIMVEGKLKQTTINKGKEGKEETTNYYVTQGTFATEISLEHLIF